MVKAIPNGPKILENTLPNSLPPMRVAIPKTLILLQASGNFICGFLNRFHISGN